MFAAVGGGARARAGLLAGLAEAEAGERKEQGQGGRGSTAGQGLAVPRGAAGRKGDCCGRVGSRSLSQQPQCWAAPRPCPRWQQQAAFRPASRPPPPAARAGGLLRLLLWHCTLSAGARSRGCRWHGGDSAVRLISFGRISRAVSCLRVGVKQLLFHRDLEEKLNIQNKPSR